MTDPYQILGVPRDAGDDEIKKAYRSLSRKYHPDANINNPNKEHAEAKFKEIQQAYQVLMEPTILSAVSGEISEAQALTANPRLPPAAKKICICAPPPTILTAAITRKP